MERAVIAKPASTPAPRALAFALAFALAVLVAVAASAAPRFPPLTGRVVDEARLLSPAATRRLDGQLAGLEARTGRQLVVATVPDLQGYEIEDYGYQLGRTWALGRKGVNDGAILLVAPRERKVRIEVGYGLEPVLTDALASVILQQKVLPQFREGRMEAGVLAGAEALIQQLSLPDDAARAQAAAARRQPAATEGGDRAAPAIFILFILLWVFLGLFGRRRGRGRGADALWLLPLIFSGRGGGRDGGFGGDFGGGGGSFGGGGSSGSW